MNADSADRHLAEARGLFERDEPGAAEALLRDALARAPAREDLSMFLATVLQSQGRLGAASETLLAACETSGFDIGVSVRCARFAQQCDRHAIAERICAGALARGSTSAELLVLAGHVARESGAFDTARERYLAALDAGADLERELVLGALAHTRSYEDPADADILRFAGHFADARYSPRSRASAGFALAKAQADLAAYADASATLRHANAIVNAVAPWSAQAWERFVAARRGEHVVSVHATVPEFVPVFIVGLPRTGTTLTASLLARATGARDRGELRALRFIADRLIEGGHSGSPAALVEAAGLYRKLAIQDDAPATWYVDQDPLNFRYLHIAAAMFPQARVIHLRRGRCDTALSLWGQDFAHADMAFAYDFRDIAAFMDGHDALMRHWKRTLRIPIHELGYEALVANPAATLDVLCGFIGAAVRAPDHAGGSAPVLSASVWQARQPVYTTSIGRWKRFAPYVPELERFGAPGTRHHAPAAARRPPSSGKG